MDNKLPIYAFKNQIINTVSENDVTIVVAETGAGKSTQIPQYLLEAGYDVIVTQPRRLAAQAVAARVAEEYGCELGEEIGYRVSGDAVHSDVTECLFVTDGLQLVKELLGKRSRRPKRVLVIDEVHEWNINIETLIAWVKYNQEYSNYKVILMSATLESKRLSKFFNDAPVIEVPGRLFPVEEREAGTDYFDDVFNLVREGRNILVFLPGKKEISELINLLTESGLNAEILPLHGELHRDEQQKCFKHYGRPKVVVSTNVAQTSITIDDIDAVIDSGVERRIELVDGVEGLYLCGISEADAKQRKGRAGRTKPGIYIDRYLLECPSLEERREFPVAEIERVRLDQTVLRLAKAGFDMDELEFFHQPSRRAIHEAKVSLWKLGCINTEGVTDIGEQVLRFPVGIQSSRMIVEAIKRGVVEDVVLSAAIFEVGQISMRKNQDGTTCTIWRKYIDDERSSDVLAQMNLYTRVMDVPPSELKNYGVDRKTFERVEHLCERIDEALERMGVEISSTGIQDDIIISICAGMVDHIYVEEYGYLMNGSMRKPCDRSVLQVPPKGIVVGIPFDIEVNGRYGPHTIEIVKLMTLVSPELLFEAAPHLLNTRERVLPSYEGGGLVSETLFDGKVVKQVSLEEYKRLR